MKILEELRSWFQAQSDHHRWVFTHKGLWVVLISVLLMLLLKQLLFPVRRSNLKLPPGPRGLPIIGHLHLLGSLPHQSLLELANRHGPLFHIHLGSIPTLVASSADMAKEFFKIHDLIFASRPKFIFGKYLAYNYQDMVFAPYDEKYKTLRRICTMELFTNKRIASFRHHREEEISFLINFLLDKSRQQKAIVLRHNLFDLTLNIITRITISKTFFGPNATRNNDRVEEFKSILEEYFRVLSLFMIGDYFPYLKWIDRLGNVRAVKKQAIAQDIVLQRLIDERRQSRLGRHGGTDAAEDFVDVLLSLSEKDQSAFLKDDIIKAVMNNVMEAGSETSAVVLEWSMTELLRHPLVLERAQQELDSVVGHDRNVDESDIPELIYLQAIIKEAMRLHPPGPLLIPHRSTADCVVKGYHIPKNTNLIVNMYAIGRDAKIWENPLQFMPERFLDSSIDVRGQDFELIPFGSGRRGCPGLTLGLIVVQMTLARMLHAFNWSPPHGLQPKDIDVAETFTISVPRKEPLQAIPSPRLPMHLYNSNL
ncbi:hypothetical protein O6H91_03G032800 [Diphasiastrum complanatum]|uniref:Uncharacterized protein n=2 Tax=Diphasiastrum complanatum TaxID=34168 RepID=A0ACC2E4W9_DIPCM|nr:hypothetical protein O6H91_03G032800 [Diphasiastrum complanatum]KAJ7561552.1 hypothetical protein O6H91_03G032800 [Diphasiastrum complanatum]